MEAPMLAQLMTLPHLCQASEKGSITQSSLSFLTLKAADSKVNYSLITMFSRQRQRQDYESASSGAQTDLEDNDYLDFVEFGCQDEKEVDEDPGVVAAREHVANLKLIKYERRMAEDPDGQNQDEPYDDQSYPMPPMSPEAKQRMDIVDEAFILRQETIEQDAG